MRSLTRRQALCLSLLAWPGISLAQPVQTATLSLEAQPSQTHRFETRLFRSRDGQRGYRVIVAIPKRAAGPLGYPSLFLCDGNAAFMTLSPQDLETVPHLAVVALGYQTHERFDLKARTLDYTPVVAGRAQADELRPENPAGGADVFADLLRDEIFPSLQGQFGLGVSNRALWGHSYGGLFALNCLFYQPDLFQTVVSASPSLWWHEGHVFTKPAQKIPAVRQAKLMVGESEINRRHIPGRVLPTPGQMVAKVRDMASRLEHEAGLKTAFEVLAGLDHGAMFAPSLRAALKACSSQP